MSTSSEVGNLGWNANGSLASLGISDPFNAPDTQNCAYTHDDLQRLAKANCGSTWGQSFSYDAFGNIAKTVLAGSTGVSWQPTYTHGTTNTNQYYSLPGFTPTYDANGNLLTDSFHTYTWDAENKMISLDSTALTYDALGRMVEQNQSGTYFEIVYSPRGKKLAIMKAQVIQQAFLPLPGKAKAEYLSWGLSHYRHPDWLGSSRLESSTTHGIIQSVAYDAFGVPYAQKSGGNGEISFTEQNKDTAWLPYDFLDRQYDPTQGRWISPDRAGLAAVDLATPQSWNRYAYVMNNPLAMVDPFGDDGCYDGGGNEISVAQVNCYSAGGSWQQTTQVTASNGKTYTGVTTSDGGVTWYGPNGEAVSADAANNELHLLDPYIAIGSDALGFIGEATHHPTLGGLGAGISILSDHSAMNIVTTAATFIPVVGEAVSAMVAVKDVGTVVGHFVVDQIMTPMFNAAPTQNIEDGYGHMIANPGLMDECQVAGCYQGPR